MNRVFKIFALLAILSSSVHTYAQSYKPDISLNYSVFLDQCINFKNQPQKQVWVVFFWAGWNSRSLYAIPDLKALHQKYQHKPVRFVSVSVDKIRSKWEKDLMRYKMDWQHLLIDREDDYNFLKRAFPHKSLPGMFVVKPDGMIHQAMSTDELSDLLEIAAVDLPDGQIITTSNNPPPASTPASQPIANSNPVTPATTSDNSESPASTPEVGNSWLTHKVKPGDTLFSLYRKYKVSVGEIKQLNGLTSNNIRIGQVLKIRRL